MIGFQLQIFLIVLTFTFMGYIIHLIRNETIELKYSLLWFCLGLILIILSFFPKIVIYLSQLFGIGLPVNTLYLVAIFFIIIILMSLTIVISKMHRIIIKLTQEISLLKLKVENKNFDSCNEK